MAGAGLRSAFPACLVVVAACAAPERDPAALTAVPREAPTYFSSLENARSARIETLVDRAERVARGETADGTIDVLMLSGGADWGAFGAGYLARWSELGDAAAYPMPEFDVIAGISTGALIATYIAAQTPDRYADIEDFYRKTSTDWVAFRGIGGLLPNSTAVLDNSGIRRVVEAALDERLLAEIRESHEDQRQLVVGTTNLDYAALQYWDLGKEAAAGAPSQERIVDILMAATGIPGVFPPVEIDGNLHADGGAVQGIPAIDVDAIPRVAERWQARHGDVPLPPIRAWWIYNNHVSLKPKAIGPGWLDVAYRSYQTISQTSFKAPLERNVLAARGAAEAGLPDVEIRWVAVPPSFAQDPDVEPFDPRTTNALADLGREVAARPDGGWRSDLPDEGET